MTIIAGLVHDGHVYLGADSYGTVDNELIRYAVPKVFRVGRCVVGVTGSHRLRQVVQYGVPLDPPTTDPAAWFAITYAAALKTATQEHGGLDKDGDLDGGLLIGCDGTIYRVDCSRAIVPLRGPYATIGSGGLVALGAFHAMYDPSHDPRDQVRRAVQVAIDLDPYCNGAIDIVATE